MYGLLFIFGFLLLYPCLFFSPQIGERQQVLVTEESFDSKFYVAHNRFYEQVRATFPLPFLQSETRAERSSQRDKKKKGLYD
jgi:hypothetical protein